MQTSENFTLLVLVSIFLLIVFLFQLSIRLYLILVVFNVFVLPRDSE